MGRISQGILGGVRGTVGTVIGGSWKGISYIRGKAASRKSSSTVKQLEQRTKFKLVADFLSTLSGLLKFGFKDFEQQQTGRNHAMAYAIQNSIAGEYPALSIDFAKVLVTMGSKIPGAAQASASAGTAGLVNFSWQGNTGKGIASANDKPLMVAHCPEMNQSIYLVAASNREAGSASLEVPAFSGKEVHTWISFQTEDQTSVATSLYTGAVLVQ